MGPARVISGHERDHFQDVVIEHQCDEFSSLTKEDGIWRLFLVMQYFLADVAARYHFKPALAPIVTYESYCEVG